MCIGDQYEKKVKTFNDIDLDLIDHHDFFESYPDQPDNDLIQSSQLELPFFNERLQKDTLPLSESPRQNKKSKKTHKNTKKQKAINGLRDSYCMFPNNVNSANVVSRQLDNINSDVNIEFIDENNQLLPSVIVPLDTDLDNLNLPVMDLPVNLDNLNIELDQDYVESSTFMDNVLNLSLSSAAIGGIIATVVSSAKSPNSDKNSNKQNPKSQNNKNLPSQNPIQQNLKNLPSQNEEHLRVDKYLNLLGCRRSLTQPLTLGDGNCLFRAICDQVPISEVLITFAMLAYLMYYIYRCKLIDIP